MNDGLFEQVAKDLVGDESLLVVRFLSGKRDVSEFVISEALGMGAGDVRKVLYRLQDKNLITYFRKKDRKKGWYVSYWTLDYSQVPYFSQKLLDNSIESYRMRLKYEEKNNGEILICPGQCTRRSTEECLDEGFHCEGCGKVLKVVDNSPYIGHLRAKLSVLEWERQHGGRNLSRGVNVAQSSVSGLKP